MIILYYKDDKYSINNLLKSLSRKPYNSKNNIQIINELYIRENNYKALANIHHMLSVIFKISQLMEKPMKFQMIIIIIKHYMISLKQTKKKENCNQFRFVGAVMSIVCMILMKIMRNWSRFS